MPNRHIKLNNNSHRSWIEQGWVSFKVCPVTTHGTYKSVTKWRTLTERKFIHEKCCLESPIHTKTKEGEHYARYEKWTLIKFEDLVSYIKTSVPNWNECTLVLHFATIRKRGFCLICFTVVIIPQYFLFVKFFLFVFVE